CPAGHGLAFVDRQALIVAGPLVQADMLLSDADLGLLLGPAFVLLYAAGLIVARGLGLRPKPGVSLALCIAVWTCGMVIMAFAASFAVLCVGRAVVGLGPGGVHPSCIGRDR